MRLKREKCGLAMDFFIQTPDPYISSPLYLSHCSLMPSHGDPTGHWCCWYVNVEKTTQWGFGHGSLDEIEKRERWLQTKIGNGSAICLSHCFLPYATTMTQSWIFFSLLCVSHCFGLCVWKCGILNFKVWPCRILLNVWKCLKEFLWN